MKKIHISYGDEKYNKSLDLLEKTSIEIGQVDHFIRYTRKWLEKTQFYHQNKFILDQPRGGGFWLYKSFIILNAMLNNEDNDIILYSDAGLQVVGDLTPLYELAAEKEKLIFKLPPHDVSYHKAKQWVKGDCFNIMGCIDPQYWEANMTNGAVSIWKNNDKSQGYIKEWLKFAIIPQCITDMPSIYPNHAEFKEHRHDQAILSNLRVKYEWELFRDPTQFGNMEKEAFTNSPYDQLFWHHRNFSEPKI